MTQCVCLVCGKRFESASSPAMPFCSNRCRRIDLHRWLGEKYSVPIEPAEETDDLEDGPRRPDEGDER